MQGLREYVLVALLGVSCVLGACHADGNGAAARLRDASNGDDWAGYGRTFGQQHFSPLTDIAAGNVGRLGLAWSVDLPVGNSVSEPIQVGGTLYVVTGYSIVHAFDATTGRSLWQYDPEVPQAAGHKLRYAWGVRGLAWWDGKIYVGTQDGRLIALDASNGKPVWSVMTLDRDDQAYITGAPRVFDGKVIIGFGGADLGPVRGYVTTYDARTGKQLWRWYTVPGNPAKGFENRAMEMAAKTWSGKWWEYGGGGTVWNGMSYDPDTDTVFLGTGNGSPWNHKVRSEGKGDNLFLASIVALEGATGKYKWHYQFNPGETWDYTATNDMAFADLQIGGRARKVVMTAPKNGFFYVLDRVSGELLSAEPFVKTTWASRIDLASGRPVENPKARYPGGNPAVVWPSNRGGHNWSPMSYSPATGLVYIPVNEKAASWTDFGIKNGEWRKASPPGSVQAAALPNLYPKTGDPRDGISKLIAWDPRTQKQAWSLVTPGPLTGGVMATAGGLVFNGHIDGKFNAYAAADGKLLWSFDAGAPVFAPPISYSVGGKQYVTVLTGFGAGAAFLGAPLADFDLEYRMQARRVLTFAIGGTAKLPRRAPHHSQAVADPDFRADPPSVARGAMVFGMNCVFCHGIDAVAGGAAPDLRASSVILDDEALASVLRDGALVPAGMPRFEEFGDQARADLRQYLRSQAADWRRTKAAPKPGAKPSRYSVP